MEAYRITGRARSGKSLSLVERARGLTGDVLFVCACPNCADAMRGLLPSSVRVMTARETALWMLDETSAERTRLLKPFEEQFLFEDLRATGLPQRQLRKILEFIYAGLAACKDWEVDWLEMTEERLVYDMLMASLSFTGGAVEAELANRAARLLQEDASLQARLGFSHVLVDDYGLLNRSSQFLCEALARESITIAGEPGFSLTAQDAHPNPAGLDEFLELYPDSETIELAPCEGEIREEALTLATLRDEFDAVVSLAKDAVSGNAESRVAIVGSNGTWLRNMANMLEEAGLAVEMPRNPVRIRDFRDEDGCARARRATLARLAADPHDGVALRSLLGFGDHLARSAEVKRLRTEHPGCRIDELDIANELRGRFADELAGAKQRGDERVTAQPGEANRVLVCTPEETFGRQFDLVVFGGFVPGWVPRRDYFDAVGARKRQLLDEARRSVDCARRAATGRLVFTSFTECDLEFAERYGIHYDHVRLRNGTRICEIASVDDRM